MKANTIHVIGASGRSGATLCRALLARGTSITPVIRNPHRWPTDLPGTPRLAVIEDTATLRQTLHDATQIVSCAHARHIPAILAAAPPHAQFVFLGSTRKFTRWPDTHGDGVLDGERAFHASSRAGVLLHPTMIYGAQGEDNVQRLAALLRRLPVVPLPAGGQALVQPIHQHDLTQAILAALDTSWPTPESLVVAGPTALSYADFARAIARAAHLPPPRIVPIPPAILLALAPLTRLPFLPTIRTAEIRRLLEDKAFDITPARVKLGFSPMSLDAGLALTFGAPPCP